MQLYFNHYLDFPEDQFKMSYPNFSPSEIACKGTRSLLVNHHALTLLQLLRFKLDKPIYLTSAYRSPWHNAAVGGAYNSKHLYGIAFDIQHRGDLTSNEISSAAKAVGFTATRGYENFTHIDLGPSRRW